MPPIAGLRGRAVVVQRAVLIEESRPVARSIPPGVDDAMRFSTTLLRALALLPILSIQASAKPLKITDVTASSTYPEEKGRTYEPKNVKDQKLSTAWFEGVDGGGLGAWIELTLEGTQTVSAVRIWNGDWITADLWKRENRMQDIEIQTSDGTKYPCLLYTSPSPRDS